MTSPELPNDLPAPDPDALRCAIEGVRVSAQRASRSRLLAVGLQLPDFDLLSAHAAWSSAPDRFYWEQPARGLAIATRGCVKAIEASGPQRMSAASAEVASILAEIERVGEATADEAGPIFVGGFGFADADRASVHTAVRGEWGGFPAGRMVLPELTLMRREAGVRCTVVCGVAPNSDVDDTLTTILEGIAEAMRLPGGPDVSDPVAVDADLSELLGEDGAEYRVIADRSHAAYCAQVSAALDAIARGDFEKVVLARSLEVQHRGHFALPRFLATLRSRYPSCTTFALGRGDDTLIAATPERLVALRGDAVDAAALAGSAPRGRTPDEDAALGRALRESKKDHAEHETVVRAVRAALHDVCDSLDGPETPELMQLEGIQHLHTPLRGRLAALRAGAEPVGVLDLVARLHPTPAVGGLPHGPALDWLARNEHLDRGWYAGPVGYVDASGSGEFWLALRTALVHDSPSGDRARARLFAGAGIVQGSDPALELAETRLKLRALLAPLTEI